MDPMKELKTVVSEAAKTLKSSFNELGYLNDARNAPVPERTGVIHLAHSFIKRGYSVCAEPSLSRKGGRIDLIASKGKHTFILEFKSFGGMKFKEVLKDTKRLARFKPCKGNYRSVKSFWEGSEVICANIVLSFLDKEINDVWKCQVGDRDKFTTLKKKTKKLKGRYSREFDSLSKYLNRQKGACAGCAPVCVNLWEAEEDQPLFLLWTAFRKSP